MVRRHGRLLSDPPRLTFEHLGDRGSDCEAERLKFKRRHAEWWHEDDRITERSNDYAMTTCGHGDPVSYASIGSVRMAQQGSTHHSFVPNFSDVLRR